MSGYSFSQSDRLKKRREFLRLQDDARKIYSKHFLLLVKETETQRNRLGVTITTKVDKRSVQRNKLKRRIREFFRLNQSRLRGKFDLVVIARQEACTCDYHQVKKELTGALRYHKLMD